MDKERTDTMVLCECEMGWLQVKYLDKEEEGIQNLNKAAKDKYPKAQYRLAKIYLRKKEKEGMDFLEKVAKHDSKAQYRLAKIYLGQGRKEEGINFLEKAAEHNLKAKYSFATMFFESRDGGTRKKKAIKYFKDLAANTEALEKLALKHPEINYKLGYIYYQIGISCKMEPRKALNYFLRYLNSESNITLQSYKHAAYQIARIYEYAQGLDSSDLDLALEYYTKAIGLEGKEDKIQKRITKLNEYKSKNAA
ncbi:MAG: tetratricopeptide repeat protein [Candidatus Amoebophilus sp.]